MAQWRAQPGVVTTPAELTYGAALKNLGGWLDEPKSAEDVMYKAGEFLDDDPRQVVGQENFAVDKNRLDNTLAAVKLVSDPQGVDVDSCVTARRGYAALELAASGQDVPFPLRLAFPSTLVQSVPVPPGDGEQQPPPEDPRPALLQRLATVNQTIDVLARATRTAYAAPAGGGPQLGAAAAREPAQPGAAGGEGEAGQRIAAAADPGVTLSGGAATSRWLLPEAVVNQLPQETVALATEVAGPLGQTPVTALASRLSGERAQVLQALTQLDMQKAERVSLLGTAFYPPDLFGPSDPKDVLPTTHGTVHPVGVGDLLMVREHVKAYEGGEVGHIENILRSEKMDRRTRRLERDEQQVTVETDVTKWLTP